MHLTATGPESAPPVLLLHGGGVAGWMWGPLRQQLEQQHRVLVPDLPGHNPSADEPYVSHAATVAELASMLTTSRPATVVGFSLGAQLAIRLASEHSALVNSAVIVSAQAKPLPMANLTLGLLGATASLARQRWFARLQARELFVPAAMMEDYISTSAGISKQTLLAAVGENVRFELPPGWSTFGGRVLVMAGQRERRLMRDSAESIHAALPGSELEIVDGCGHGIPLQRPEWFGARISEWLDAG